MLSLFVFYVEMVVGYVMYVFGKYNEVSVRFVRSASLASTFSWCDIGILCLVFVFLCCEEEDSVSCVLELVKFVVRLYKE